MDSHKPRFYRLVVWYVAIPCLLLVLASCEPAEIAISQPVTISIAGATAMQPVLIDLTDAFRRQHAQVFFDITGGASTIGEERVRLDQVQLAASTLISRSISSALTTAQQKQPLVRIPIGLDALAIVVHEGNPVQNLTLLQLQELYSGRIWNWQMLGGEDEAVILVTREDGSGSRILFDERVMGESPVALTAVVMPTSGDVVDYVARHPTAIGYVSRAYVIDLLADVKRAPLATITPPGTVQTEPTTLQIVTIEDQLPTLDALEAQSYFLIQPLYLVSHGQPQGWVRQFVDFALSPAGQRIVSQYHLPIR